MKRKQRIKNLLSKRFVEYSIEIIDNSHLHVGHNNFNGTGDDANAFVMEARLLGRASLIHLSIPTGTSEMHFHARVPGLNSLQTGSPVRVTVDKAQAFVFPSAD